MDAALADRESNFNASDDNSCDTDSYDTIHFHHTIVCDFNGESSVWGLEIIAHPVSHSIGASINNLGGRRLVSQLN